MSSRLVRLDDHEIVVGALKAAKRADLGDMGFSEPLAVLCGALDSEADLHTVGRAAARGQLVAFLVSRARAAEALRGATGVAPRSITAPIFVIGMPASGTAYLHRALAQLPTSVHLDATTAAAPTRNRRARADHGAARFAPPPASIATTGRQVTEETWLLATDLATMWFECAWHVPSFAEWYDSADFTAAYGNLRALMSLIDCGSGHGASPTWVLSSFQHLEQLGPLLSAFPDATVVHLHRDQTTVVEAFVADVIARRSMTSNSVEPDTIARYWRWRCGVMADRSREQRPGADDRFVDVEFDELADDPMRVIERILDTRDERLTGGARDSLAAWLRANAPAR